MKSNFEPKFDPILLNHNRGWFLGWGIVLLLLGIFAITAAAFTTWISVVTLGALLLVTGAILLIDSFHYWWSKENGFSWYFIMGCLYSIFGFACIINPMVAASVFTLLLAVLFIVMGIARVIVAQSYQLPGWGWNLTSGLLSLILGIVIIVQWPASSLFIIGLFIGIDLFFLGWSYIMVSFLAKRAA